MSVPAAVGAEAQASNVSISGPSVLGLGEQSDTSSLDYLLDDDEPARGRTGVTVLIAIVLLGGAALLGWHRWSASFRAQTTPPAAMVSHPPGFSYDHTSAAALEAGEPSLGDALADTRMALEGIAVQRVSEDIAAEQLQRQALKEATMGHPEPKGSDDEEDGDLTPAELTLTGEQYLFARGTRRDCQKAMSNFQSAADGDDTRAMVRLGEMYARGTCVKRDRVTAYNWYRRAKDADPKNLSLDARMDHLWQQMSRSERSGFLK